MKCTKVLKDMIDLKIEEAVLESFTLQKKLVEVSVDVFNVVKLILYCLKRSKCNAKFSICWLLFTDKEGRLRANGEHNVSHQMIKLQQE